MKSIPLAYKTSASIASAFVVAVMAAVSMAVVYFLLAEPPYLSYGNLPFPALVKRVEQGEPVALTVLRCNSSSVTHVYDMTRSLINHQTGKSTALPGSARIPIAPGCHVEINRANIIKIDTEPGVYSIWGMAFAQGTLRTHTISWQSQPFEVIPKPEKDQEKTNTAETGKTGEWCDFLAGCK